MNKDELELLYSNAVNRRAGLLMRAELSLAAGLFYGMAALLRPKNHADTPIRKLRSRYVSIAVECQHSAQLDFLADGPSEAVAAIYESNLLTLNQIQLTLEWASSELWNAILTGIVDPEMMGTIRGFSERFDNTLKTNRCGRCPSLDDHLEKRKSA